MLCLVYAGLSFTMAMAQYVRLDITMDKTTSLIFPFTVVHVDRGTKEVLVQKVKNAENILMVKAASRAFAETNLSVVTDDGSIYSFVVVYVEKPASWVYRLPGQSGSSVADDAKGIRDNPKTVHGVRDRKWNVGISLKGIYIRGGVLFCQLELENSSSIDYDIRSLRFFIRDKKKSKRTASQEIELRPIHASGNKTLVKAYSKSVMVVALEKFTIPEAKYLLVECMEGNGGRNVKMKINNGKIIKAIPLPG